MFTRKIVLNVLGVMGSMMAASGQLAVTATRQVDLPPAGIGSGETMQITVTNLASNTASGTAASCTGSISFLNTSGATIGAATSYTIGAGHSFAVKLPFLSAAATGTRVDVRGVIMSTQSTSAPCNLAYSLQTYDTNTGATHLYLATTPVTSLPIAIPVTFSR